MYWKWVENYVAPDYVEAVRKGSGEEGIGRVRLTADNMIALIEESICKQTPARVEELVAMFLRVTHMEIQFWNLGPA